MKDVIRIASKGSAVIMRETLIVIRNECEESIPVVRKVVRRKKPLAVSCQLQANYSFTI